jgi:hypothetical protein
MRRAALAPVLALLTALAGCGSSMENQFTVFADPGKYEFYTCKQINDAKRNDIARQSDLKGLIEKAERSTSGAVIGALAYRSDYIAIGEDLKVVEATERIKNCPPPAPAPTAAAQPAPKAAVQPAPTAAKQ